MESIKNKVKSPHKVGVVKLVVILAMVAILPLSAFMTSLISAKFGTTSSEIDATNRLRRHETNRSNWDDLHDKHIVSSNLRAVDDETTQIFELGYNVLDMLEEGLPIQQVFDYFLLGLTKEQSDELGQVLFNAFGKSETVENSDNLSSNLRGMHNTHIVFAVSYGYLVGTIASYLIGWLIGSVFTVFVTTLIGLLVVGIISAIFAEVLGWWLDLIILENEGIIYSYRQVLLTFGVWWFWGSSDTDLNLFDLIMIFMGSLGGSIKGGPRPAGVAKPSFA